MSMKCTGSEKREEKLEIRLTDKEKNEIRNQADNLNINMASYARMKIFSNEV